ncbi:peptidoglycan-associated lipoprotein Pal [Pseudodesulfovibrio aespoeensis]|uniref:peptidoglycan-associated lipoprotein Pal n=1 Tax=Pseudodesulfovibrio aespoeensis TaxID=182210 RepID=UPI002352F3E2|nr:peptidoglycan-associated lipoprotein Pal [Pseudodesulfovibrio aespoeensis]MCG2732363.1 peptidoglycan-associated lipoprotein Pal [Pseudodesulfovibrio aespoeensis]
MTSRWYFSVLILLVLALGVGAGCAKKKTTTTPPGAQVEDTDESQWKSSSSDSSMDEATLASEAERRAKTEAVTELTSVTINFAFDSYELNSEARSILALKANIMRRYTDVRVVVEGHCDERGTEEYNLALGERRARAAYEHLVILGVDPGRMSIVSFGEEKPLDSAHNETAWAKNRRAEFVVR